MAINVNAGFAFGSNDAVDSRMVLTKEQMLNINENTQPDVYLATCLDDGCLYIYNKNNVVNAETGKFSIVKAEGGALVFTKAEWEALDPKPAAGTQVIISDDTAEDDTENIIDDDTTDATDKTWSAKKINDSLVDIKDELGIKKKTITASVSSSGNINANLSATQIAIMVIRTDADSPVVIVRDKLNNTNVHCYKDWSLSSYLTSGTVTCDVYYIEM